MSNQTEGSLTIHANIRKLMRNRKRGLRAFAIRDLYSAKFGKYYSESGFTARLREMKDIKCNLSSYEYRMEAVQC